MEIAVGNSKEEKPALGTKVLEINNDNCTD